MSADMVKTAGAKSVIIANLKALIQDAQDLSAFADNSVDCVVCSYGYMFPPDKVKALSEAHRVLKPGGALISTHWVTVSMVRLQLDMLEAIGGGGPNATLDADPTCFKEPGTFEQLVRSAGFRGAIDAVQSQYPFDLGSDRDFAFKASSLLLRSKLDQMGASAHKAARKVFDEKVSEYATTDASTGSIVLENNVFAMITAFKA
jgi:SAM-dependent methyltransferase